MGEPGTELYAHAAVREHQMSFVRELLERYDPDGLELDWMRFGYHLTPGREQEEGTILTEFVREVRDADQGMVGQTRPSDSIWRCVFPPIRTRPSDWGWMPWHGPAKDWSI